MFYQKQSGIIENSDFSTFIFFNTDISVNIHSFELIYFVYDPNTPLKGSVSQILYLCASFYFMSKNG